MRVENMLSKKSGRGVANQFRIYTDNGVYFQSYGSIIAFIPKHNGYNVINALDGKIDTRIQLDENTWNYSRTTSKYRNQFLNETTEETKKKIKSGEYLLANLN